MHRLATALLALAVLALVGCGSGGQVASEGVGSMKVYVTDAPFPFTYVKSAFVTITEVRARAQGDGEDAGGWTVLYPPQDPVPEPGDGDTGGGTAAAEEEGVTLDLLQLTGGVVALLSEVDVPAGTYDEIRVIVSDGSVELFETAHVQGTDYVFDVENGGLKFPSGSSSGVKIKLDEPVVVESGLSAAVTLDFELEKNFVFNGPPDHAPGVKRVLFSPVIRATNTTTAGSIRLMVLSDVVPDPDVPAQDATVIVWDAAGTTEIARATPDATGSVVVVLKPGSYLVDVMAFGHISQTSIPALVEVGLEDDLDTILLTPCADLHGTVYSDPGTVGDTSDDTILGGVEVVYVSQTDPAVTAKALSDKDSGLYWFENLTPDTYDVTFTDPGGLHAVLGPITVVVGLDQSQVLDATLTSTP